VLLIHEGRLLGNGPPGSFTAEMAGRTFFAKATLGRRRLQERLTHTPGVIDAVIQGSQVRVVTRAAAPPDPTKLFSEAPDLTLTATPPRFEDSFVARLRERVDATAPRAPLEPTPPASTAVTVAEDVIVVQHVTRRFGNFVAVNDVNFTVARGEIFGLLGANGAGKSTTFRMLCGLLPPSAGTLQVDGFDLRRAAAPARGRIGYMAQKFSLYGDLSVRQNLRFFSSAYRIDWAKSEFDLGQMLDATARDLPLGFKQRLALACALMHEPDILFLDEPTSGVDPLARREFWRRINALSERGVTVLVTTHFMEEAEYCDRLVIMAQGRILATGEPETIKGAARTSARPDPTMEDAFIAVIKSGVAPAVAA
jgi:ABC-2 type transport system ATP-binding protein